MDLFLIGDPGAQKQRIGVSRSARDTLAEMQAQNAPGLELTSWEGLETGRATLIMRAFEIENFRTMMAPEWFMVSRDFAKERLEAIQGKIFDLVRKPGDRPRGNLAGLMLHLRQDVFRTTQETMGAIAGRTTVYISRWEAGVGTPGLEELLRIRAAALSLGLPWDDTDVLGRTLDDTQEEGRHGK